MGCPMANELAFSSPPPAIGRAVAAIKEGDASVVEAIMASPEGNSTSAETWRTYLACMAAHHGQADCMRAILKAGVDLCGIVCLHSANRGHLSCLRLANQLGDHLTELVAICAAVGGHLDCLAFTLEQGLEPDDTSLYVAMAIGHLGCVELLVAHGLSRDPIKLTEARDCSQCPSQPGVAYKGLLKPNKVRCLQHLFDKGCAVDPVTLITAARCGDVDLVRLLHARGVPLWTCAWEEERPEQVQGEQVPERVQAHGEQGPGEVHIQEPVPGQAHEEVQGEESVITKAACMCGRLFDCEEMKILPIPPHPQDAEHMWKALMYGSVMGAPVTPGIGEVLKGKRRSTRTVLLSFHLADQLSRGEGSVGRPSREKGSAEHLSGGKGSAERLSGGKGSTEQLGPGKRTVEPLSRGKGSAEQRAAWSAMMRVPLEVIDKILVLADFEIPESLRRSLFGQPPAGAQGRIARVALTRVEGTLFRSKWEFTPARFF